MSNTSHESLDGQVALVTGAAADSIALIGFGLDSVLETAASVVLLWRLGLEARGASQERIDRAEHRVHRFVGFTFFALAAYVVGEAGWTLWTRHAPSASTVGIILATASVILMPGLAWAKLRTARKLGSGALRAEAKETLACSLLSAPLLIGLAANAWAGWWWADPFAALAMVPWLIHEGLENLAGEDCCH